MLTFGGSPTSDCFRIGPWLVLASAFVGILGVADSEVFSQGIPAKGVSHSRERTRALIDDYTNSQGSDSDFDLPRQPSHRTPGDAGSFDAKALRPLIRAFSDSMTQLTYALNDQMSQVSGLRPIYTEALRLSGTAVSVNKHAEKHGADRTLQDQLQQLDANWRELAYRMENLRGLSGDARSLVADINDADQRIRQLIGIQPQLDRRQLYLKAASLAADLDSNGLRHIFPE